MTPTQAIPNTESWYRCWFDTAGCIDCLRISGRSTYTQFISSGSWLSVTLNRDYRDDQALTRPKTWQRSCAISMGLNYKIVAHAKAATKVWSANTSWAWNFQNQLTWIEPLIANKRSKWGRLLGFYCYLTLSFTSSLICMGASNVNSFSTWINSACFALMQAGFAVWSVPTEKSSVTAIKMGLTYYSCWRTMALLYWDGTFISDKQMGWFIPLT